MTSQSPIPSGAFDRRAIPAAAEESYWAAPDGHEIRRVDWPAPQDACRGSLLFLPGRADFFEKYLETLDHWHRLGWQVTSSDWRGQALSGRLGQDGFTGHIADFGIWADDLGALWRQWKDASPGPHVIVAHSMGGHVVLRALAAGLVDPEAVVLTAPMLGLVPAFMPIGVMHFAARLMVRLRGAQCSAWKGSEKPGRMPEDRFDLLTHDPERYADEIWWRRNRPELAMGAPSWGWIERAIASIRALHRPGTLEVIQQPVLIVAAKHDGLVGYGATESAAPRLPHAELVAFGKEARHEILRECDAVRDKALAAIDGFLDRVAPAGKQSR